uniref:L-type lectin-domain containing receptor kinase S.6-like n=1 Tax=Erigeron canadensis TaxID=72917 RepID=UPI001CB90AAC|nr:L-type lectin-domain containing receptor kinase S.6-like [Erigeron canadensis]
MKFKNLIFLFIFFITPISSSSSNFTLFGTAHINKTTISLTQNPNPNCNSNPPLNTGRIFSKNPVRVLDSGFNSTTTLSFSTHFSFTIIPHCLPGEGLAFVITSDSVSLPYSVNCIGLPKDLNPNSNSLDEFSTSNSYGFFAVEFDTSYDQNFGDINDNHVGIDLDSIFSIASVDLVTNGVDLRNGGKVINSWIEYNSSKKVVQVWVGYDRVRPVSPILVAPVDLSKKFNGFMYVGFSGSSGKGSDSYMINSWEFKMFGSESGFQNFDVEAVGLNDCLICFPEGLVQENGPAPKTGQGLRSDHHSGKKVLSLVLKLLVYNLGLLLVIGVGVVIFFVLRKARNRGQNGPEEAPARMPTYHEDTNTMPKRFKFSEIRSATKGFNRNLIIGEGVSAIVYKTDINIAVKRFKTGSYGSQFASEFVTIVGSLRHKNLMKLQGWCCEKNELILVYEYMPNGSLVKMLHNPENDLSFKSRLNILLGVSSALVYLHEECERPIIHRNVKSCNIMLDSNYMPKLGDFGMAELYEHGSRTHDLTVSARCMGYLAPEYVYSGVPTVKTDVYSFGVVVLEVASGRPAVDKYGAVVTDWVWDLWEEKKLVAAADGNLMGRFNRVEMEKVLSVGLICVHPNYRMRPTMKDVMKMLKGEMAVKLPAVKPTVMIQSVTTERSPEMVLRSGGDDSITIWGTPASHFSK